MDTALAINIAAVVAELREVREEQERIHALLKGLPEAVALAVARTAPLPKPKGKSGASADDRTRIAVLLPVLQTCLKDRTFTVSDLVKAYAARFPALRAVLDDHRLSGKQIGKLFARFHDADIGGLTIHRQGKEHDGCIWRVVSVLGKSEKVAKTHEIGMREPTRIA